MQGCTCAIYAMHANKNLFRIRSGSVADCGLPARQQLLRPPQVVEVENVSRLKRYVLQFSSCRGGALDRGAGAYVTICIMHGTTARRPERHGKQQCKAWPKLSAGAEQECMQCIPFQHLGVYVRWSGLPIPLVNAVKLDLNTLFTMLCAP